MHIQRVDRVVSAGTPYTAHDSTQYTLHSTYHTVHSTHQHTSTSARSSTT